MNISTLYEKFKDSNGVSTDTRKIHKGSIFFALKGEQFNGNEFALQALKTGASYAVVDEEEYKSNDRCILVEDALYCLQDLASHHRTQFNIPFIGITGSNGKTTTKELIRDVLLKKYKVHATKGNLNNHIGVALTLLEVDDSHEVVIIEMGANHVDEIALLSSIADPDIGLITNIGKAHIGEFGGYENIVKGKTELYDHIARTEGLVFVNGESAILMDRSKNLNRIIYGDHSDSDLLTQGKTSGLYLAFEWDDLLVDTKLIGTYNLPNINAAICIGQFFQVDDELIRESISSYDPDNNRSQLMIMGSNQVIMDAYNANPTSMKAALDNLSDLKSSNKFAILGHMLELGDESEIEHRHLIELARIKGIDAIFIGEEFSKLENSDADFISFNSVLQASDHIRSLSLEDTLILIKGSRGIKLEDALEFI